MDSGLITCQDGKSRGASCTSLASTADLMSAILPTSHQALPVPLMLPLQRGHRATVFQNPLAQKLSRRITGMVSSLLIQLHLFQRVLGNEIVRLLAARDRNFGNLVTISPNYIVEQRFQHKVFMALVQS